MSKHQRAVVSMLVVRDVGNGQELLLQRRTKHRDDTPYNGFLELPQGKVQAGESLREAVRRELEEETRLRLVDMLEGDELPLNESEPTSKLFSCDPLMLVTDTVQNHIGIAIVVSVDGDAQGTSEATDHVWVQVSRINDLLTEEKIFPLNRPMLLRYHEQAKRYSGKGTEGGQQ